MTDPRPVVLTEKDLPGLRTILRLFRDRTHARVCRLTSPGTPCSDVLLRAVTHRFEEHIAGRTYQIEVCAISQTRWRAQIARLPGMPTALMPFYGATPEAAAHELSRWLTLVYKGSSQ